MNRIYTIYKKYVLAVAVVLVVAGLALATPYITPMRNNVSFLLRTIWAPQTVTIASNGVGSSAVSYTISTVDKSMYAVNCGDTDGCRLYLGETDAQPGQISVIANTGSNTVTVYETTNVLNLSAATVALGTDDTVTVIRNTDGNFVQQATANN